MLHAVFEVRQFFALPQTRHHRQRRDTIIRMHKLEKRRRSKLLRAPPQRLGERRIDTCQVAAEVADGERLAAQHEKLRHVLLRHLLCRLGEHHAASGLCGQVIS